MQIVVVIMDALISIHALLAESDFTFSLLLVLISPFLSTLSLRRATTPAPKLYRQNPFLSTLSLRRATVLALCFCGGACDFYPRSPCGERLDVNNPVAALTSISIHALLAESDHRPCDYTSPLICISIHALLAESDWCRSAHRPGRAHFYPRSPCGERLAMSVGFIPARIFLSTLSLRRATKTIIILAKQLNHFYPRSPCGERRRQQGKPHPHREISIHALLAESDICECWTALNRL